MDKQRRNARCPSPLYFSLLCLVLTGTVRAEPMESELLVRFASRFNSSESEAHLARYGCSVTGRCEYTDIYRVRVEAGHDSMDVIAALEGDPRVRYAERNVWVWAALVPNDTFFAFQWNLQGTERGGINAQAAWDIHTGDPNVIVAVLDTGVAYEDFEGFLQAPDLRGSRFVSGYDFINEDSHPNDDHGHGTHVAGTIAQSTNNEFGVAGIAFDCSLMPVKVLDVNGLGDHFTIARGLYFAVDNGARVINLSLGAPGFSQTLYEAMAYAFHCDVTVVCAAGNDFLRGNPVIYPAAYDDFCIAVGASTLGLTRAFYSGTGDFVDLVAPGGDLFFDDNEDSYGDGILQQTFRGDPQDFSFWFQQGTSMAAPHVSGAAALLISKGIRTPQQVRWILEQTAIDLGPVGYDPEFGWGLIDLGAAMAFDPDALGDIQVPLTIP